MAPTSILHVFGREIRGKQYHDYGRRVDQDPLEDMLRVVKHYYSQHRRDAVSLSQRVSSKFLETASFQNARIYGHRSRVASASLSSVVEEQSVEFADCATISRLRILYHFTDLLTSTAQPPRTF